MVFSPAHTGDVARHGVGMSIWLDIQLGLGCMTNWSRIIKFSSKSTVKLLPDKYNPHMKLSHLAMQL